MGLHPNSAVWTVVRIGGYGAEVLAILAPRKKQSNLLAPWLDFWVKHTRIVHGAFVMKQIRELIASRKDRRSFTRRIVSSGFGLIAATGWLGRFSAKADAGAQEFDVIVAGSGAAGMTAALAAAKRGLKVVVIDASSYFGGSTARSGGGIWIRNNPINQAAGVQDSQAEAEEYLAAVAGEFAPRELQQAFLAQGPKMVQFLLEQTPLKFRRMAGYSDYYPELPGGKAEGASIEPEIFDGNLLGVELAKLNPPYIPTPTGVVIYAADYKWLCLAKVTLHGARVAAQAVRRYVEACFRRQKPLTMGQALAAGLRAGLIAAGVPVWLDTPLVDLSVDADGRVNGVKVCKNGLDSFIKAKHGVIVATGGF